MADDVDVHAMMIELYSSVKAVNRCAGALRKAGFRVDLRLSENTPHREEARLVGYTLEVKPERCE